MSDTSRVLVLGLDGANMEAIIKGINNGLLPNMKSLMDEGGISTMKAPLPPTTPVSMASILTGKSPGEHQIFSFETDPRKGGYNCYEDIEGKTLFDFLSEKKVISINTPMTSPPPKINGKLVSGFPSERRRKGWPPELNRELNKSNYRIEPIDFSEGKESFIQDVFNLAEERFRLAQRWITDDWDLFLLWFTGDARLQHYVDDPEILLDFYKKIDQYLGDLLKSLQEEITVLMVSDHGFTDLEVEFNVGEWLRRKNYMPDHEDEDWDKLYGEINLDKAEFEAFPAGAYMSGIYASESVKEELIKELKEIEFEGKKIFSQVYDGEEFYGSKKAPDILPVPVRGVNYVSKNSEELFDQNPDEVRIPDREGVILSNSPVLDFSERKPKSKNILPFILSLLDMNSDRTENEKLVN